MFKLLLAALLLVLDADTVFSHYDPSLGRWLNRDPIEEAGSDNLFQFVFNSPADRIDPLGECPPLYAAIMLALIIIEDFNLTPAPLPIFGEDYGDPPHQPSPGSGPYTFSPCLSCPDITIDNPTGPALPWNPENLPGMPHPPHERPYHTHDHNPAEAPEPSFCPAPSYIPTPQPPSRPPPRRPRSPARENWPRNGGPSTGGRVSNDFLNPLNPSLVSV